MSDSKEFESMRPHLPWDVCKNSANAMAYLIHLYENLFTLRCIPHFAVQTILTASITQLVNCTPRDAEERETAVERLKLFTTALEKISISWPSAGKTLHVIYDIALKWQVPIAWMSTTPNQSCKSMNSNEPDVSVATVL